MLEQKVLWKLKHVGGHPRSPLTPLLQSQQRPFLEEDWLDAPRS